jgi:hypothetical protein
LVKDSCADGSRRELLGSPYDPLAAGASVVAVDSPLLGVFGKDGRVRESIELRFGRLCLKRNGVEV